MNIQNLTPAQKRIGLIGGIVVLLVIAVLAFFAFRNNAPAAEAPAAEAEVTECTNEQLAYWVNAQMLANDQDCSLPDGSLLSEKEPVVAEAPEPEATEIPFPDECVPAREGEVTKTLPSWCPDYATWLAAQDEGGKEAPAAPKPAEGEIETGPEAGNENTGSADDEAEKQNAMLNCPTDKAMSAETGITRYMETKAPGDWETCKWQIVVDGKPINLPADARLTAKMVDGTHRLFVGPVSNLKGVYDGTLRLTRGYVSYSYVQDSCKYAEHEYGYAATLSQRTNGSDQIDYTLGNFTCPGYTTSSTETWVCPVTNDNASDILGGTGSWEQSPDDPSLFVYTGIGGWESGSELNYPGYGWYEFWQNPEEKLTSSIPDDNATFHCVEK